MLDNAITLLKKDHLMVKGLFKALKALDKLDIGGKEQIYKKLEKEIKLHSDAEEIIFYPTIRDADPEIEKIVAHSYEDHAEIESFLEELNTLDKSSVEWSATLDKLEEAVEEHVKEEEEVLFKKAEEKLGEEKLKELGKQIKEEKEVGKEGYE